MALFALHFVHLRADFPNHSRWRDWAKYTDEGWYGNAAINQQIRRGPVAATFTPQPGTASWRVDGDFNPAVALPVWPVLLAGIFHFTGLSIGAARALSVAVLGLDCCLLFLLARQASGQIWIGLAAVTIALSNYYVFVFDRLAILEPMATGFLLAALLLAIHRREERRSRPKLVLLGFICCLLLLTKTTGLFLLPGVFYLLRPNGSLRSVAWRWVSAMAVAGGAAALFYGGYFLLVRHAGYAVDFRYLFTSNVYPRPASLFGWWLDARSTVRGVFWMGRVLPWAAVAGTLVRTIVRRGLPVFDGALWLGTGVYLFFIFLHNNPQPRYYVPVAMLFILLAVLGAAELAGRGGRVAAAGLLAALAILAGPGVVEIVRYLRHPEYTLVNAAQALTAYIDAHPNGNRILLSTSGNQVSLITGLPAICDDYGPWDLPERIAQYQPGWFAAWNDIDAGTLQDIHMHDWLERAATFPAMDDPERNVLILYKMHPLPGRDVGVPEDEEQP
jgi:hypothetical protein